MTKYNHIKCIPISTVPKEEIRQAIREWAEGNSHMEELLWACFNHNIETSGSHAGARPYLNIRVNNSQDKIKKMLYEVQKIDGVQILISPDGGNPFSGPNWYRPGFSFGFLNTMDEESANDIFDKMRGALSDNKAYKPEKSAFEPLLDFHDFFAGKESNLTFRAKYISGQYTFSIEAMSNDRNSAYFTNLFKKTELKPIKSPLECIKVWGVNTATPEEFHEKLIACKNVIMSEWSLGLPEGITKDTGLWQAAHIKKREFGDTIKGQEQFEKWLQDEWKKMMAHRKANPNKNVIHQTKNVYQKVKEELKAVVKRINPFRKEIQSDMQDETIEQNTANRKDTQTSFKKEIVVEIAEKGNNYGEHTQIQSNPLKVGAKDRE